MVESDEDEAMIEKIEKKKKKNYRELLQDYRIQRHGKREKQRHK